MKATFLEVEQSSHSSGPTLGSDGPQCVRLAERGFQHKAQEQQMLQLSKQTYWVWVENLLLYC